MPDNPYPAAPPLPLRARIKTFWERYERHLTAAAFIVGFVFDSLTLRRVDLLLENLAFLAYLGIAAACIVLVNAFDGGRLSHRASGRALHWLPLLMQFSFGALLSGFFVFYSRSASLVRSWPFLLLLLGLFIGNEVFKARYSRLAFQTSVFFFIAFSYAIFAVPVVFRAFGTTTFLVSGAVGLAAVATLLAIVRRASPARFAESRRIITASIAAIYAAFNLLYFTNILPPIPLSLTEIGVYHGVARTAAAYRAAYEPVAWYELGKRIRPVFNRVSGEPVYVFSAVFAPTALSVPILHEWSRYDERAKRWIASTRIRFTISGGADGGYRGYSLKENLAPGRWRVDVVTERGALIGRITFRIQDAQSALPLREKIL